jgi:two-component system alkaline phosphatase synthesis response regulator PhoP
MPSELILLVDDEPSIIELAHLYLQREGYQTTSAKSGREALDSIQSSGPALVVLDVMLPGLDGFEVCRRLRREGNEVPILMLTARDDDIDKILGLELGADDYLTKPFNPRELVARVKAILRRGTRPSENREESLKIHDLAIDLERREVHVKGNPINLRTQEFEVLYVLAQNRGRVLTREQLLNLAWGYDFYGQTRTVDVHVAQLRRKLAASLVKIETVTGIGYKLTD